MARRTERPVYPVPELISDDSVRIVRDEDGGSMDNTGKVMRVPLANTPKARHVRAHEMAHAKYSPKSPKAPANIAACAVQRAEDMRMNLKCRENGLDDAMDAPLIDSDAAGDLMWPRLLTGQVEDLTAGLSCYRTGDWAGWLENTSLGEDAVSFIESAWNRLERNPVWDETISVAKDATDFFKSEIEPPADSPDTGDDTSDDTQESGESDNSETGEDSPEDESPDDGEDDGLITTDDKPGEDESMEGEPSEDGEGSPSDSEGDDTGDGESSPGGEPSESGEGSDEPIDDGPMAEIDLSGDMLDKMVDLTLEVEAKVAKESAKGAFENGIDALQEFDRRVRRPEADIDVTMKVVTLKMPVRMAPSRLKSRAKVGREHGRIPTYMHRMATDKNIFQGSSKRRDKGGAILIDCSGSMGLTSKDVAGIVDKAPLGTVATYCGQNHGSHGELRIVAAKGKRAADTDLLTDPYMQTNLVDVPALRWLAKQDGPRYWICDGIVTGGGDGGECSAKNVTAACVELCERYRITMVPSVEALMEIL